MPDFDNDYYQRPDTRRYRRAEIQDVLDASPHEGEHWFRLQVSGAATSKHLNITADELARIRDVLVPPDGNHKFIAHYTPEAWVNDNAIETDPEGEQEWDATEAVYAVKGWADELITAMQADSFDREFGVVDRADILKTDRNAPAWVRQHRGPCTIRVRLADPAT